MEGCAKGLTEVSVGEPAPNFAARDLNGKWVNLKELIAGCKVFLLFYRGGWCPVCNRQLAGRHFTGLPEVQEAWHNDCGGQL